MAGGNNPKKKKKKGKGKGKQGTENEERNSIFQSVWGCFQPLLRLLLWLLSAAISGVRALSWIPWVLVFLFFHLAWITLVCVQSGLHILVRVLSICLQSLLLAVPWTLWLFMLIEGVDLGCSLIRITVLAAPFLMSKRFVWIVQLTLNHMWPSWLLRLLQGNCSSTGQPAVAANFVEQNLDNGHHGIAANLISVEQYLDAHPATTSHPTYQFQIPTREGLNLWQGFIDIVLNAYEGNESWAGTFTEEHLRMSGSECRIDMEPSYPATFENLLLDLAQLAALLFGYFETPNQMAPRCIQVLYSSMTAPLLGTIPAPSAQQIENFLKFIRNQPALKPARKSDTFLTKVFQARRAMGAIERAIIDQVITSMILPADWMNHISGLGYKVLTRTVLYRKYHPNNQTPTYGSDTEEFFRFLRNVFEHGGDLDAGKQLVHDMEDLDYIASEVFSDRITELIGKLVMGVDMTGMLKHAWEDYQ